MTAVIAIAIAAIWFYIGWVAGVARSAAKEYRHRHEDYEEGFREGYLHRRLELQRERKRG